MSKLLSPELQEVLYVQMYIAALSRSTSNRAARMKNLGFVDGETMLRSFGSRLTELKVLYNNLIYEQIKNHPMQLAAKGVYRMNGLALFKLLYYIDFEKADTPAALWRYVGLGVKGQNSDYMARLMGVPVVWSGDASRRMVNMRLKLVCKRSPYRPIYDARRIVEEIEKFYPPRRASKMALRYTEKLWLKHLWLVGRRLCDLPTGDPHPDDSTADPTAFGWTYGADPR